MSLQVAPDVINFEVAAANDSQMTIHSLSDNSVGFRVNTIAGAAITNVQMQPVLTVVRRPATAQNGATKYTIKIVHPVYDLLGAVAANALISTDVVIPSAYLLNSEAKLSGVLHALSAFVASDLFATMAEDGSFLR